MIMNIRIKAVLLIDKGSKKLILPLQQQPNLNLKILGSAIDPQLANQGQLHVFFLKMQNENLNTIFNL